jgi:hypothetical protein
MGTVEPLKYIGPTLTPGTGSLADASGTYASMADAITAAGGASRCAELKLDERTGDRPMRVSFSAELGLADGQQASERAYLVTLVELDGVKGVRLDQLYDATWTCGATGVPSAAGGRTHSAAAMLTPRLVSSVQTGLAAARLGCLIRDIAQLPAAIEVWDAGEANAILRVFSSQTAGAGVAPTAMRWR